MYKFISILSLIVILGGSNYLSYRAGEEVNKYQAVEMGLGYYDDHLNFNFYSTEQIYKQEYKNILVKRFKDMMEEAAKPKEPKEKELPELPKS